MNRLRVDSVFQSLASLEARRLGSSDLDGFLGLGVDTLTSRTLSNFERTETNQLNLLTLEQFFSNDLLKSLQSLFCILLADFCLRRYYINKI